MIKNKKLLKKGRLGSLCLAFGLAVICIYGLRVNLLPEPQQQADNNGHQSNQQTETELSAQDQARTTSDHIKSDPIPDFSRYTDVAEKKNAFFNFLRPAILKQNKLIQQERTQLLELQQQLINNKELTQEQQLLLNALAEKYQVKYQQFDQSLLAELLIKVNVIPENLVLIQAANETGWGSSRFARKGNNFFGQWCFKQGCGLVPLSRTSGLKHEVAVFDSVESSVASYMKNLNTNAAYALLRQIRADLQVQNKQATAEDLIHGLINYSERQQEYVDELLAMLRHNQKYLGTTNE